MTGDTKYQDVAWSMFEAINKYTRTPSGFTRITNVDTLDPEQDDFQERQVCHDDIVCIETNT